MQINVTIEEDFEGAETIQIQSIEPTRNKRLSGRVKSFTDDHAVFENDMLLIFSALDEKPQLTKGQDCDCIVIETDQVLDGNRFQWRIAKLLNIYDSSATADIGTKIVMADIKFNVQQKVSTFETKYVNIFNQSTEVLTLVKCQLESNQSELISLAYNSQSNSKPICTLKSLSGCHKLKILITPRNIGFFSCTLSAVFSTFRNETIEKRCTIDVEVVQFVTNIAQYEKIRFTDISLEPYLVPNELLAVSFVRFKEAADELTRTFPFLQQENLNESEHLLKMHYGLYLEEIELSLAFAKLQIKHGQFENVGDFLKLEVKDVAEKRPSLIVGDSIVATDPHRCEANQPADRGRICAVENDAILVKFADEFHKRHHGNSFKIDFDFSRSMFRYKHHSLDTITLPTKLGYNFMFFKLEDVKWKKPQLDIKLEGGKLILNDTKIEWFDKRLNVYQQEAVTNVIRGECRPHPYCIYGPPGK